jgi:UDP-2,3-diacylglucosamine pyrophosphatase LpxH
MATYLNISSERNRKKTIPFSSLGRPAWVLSDLHLAAGLNENGNYEGTENFYYDQSFVRFVDHLQEKASGTGGLLVINGDFVDFSRITNRPHTEEAFREWQDALAKVDTDMALQELKASISKKEERYVLKTHDYKSVWKLHVCIEGHRPLFQRLAQWLQDGNELIIVKGNHDLEWMWPAVQRYLRVRLEESSEEEKLPAPLASFQQAGGEGAPDAKAVSSPPAVVAPPVTHSSRIHFIDHALTIDDKIHIEHGHLYERTTAVVGEPTVNNGQELNYPFGSFFNRYLINRLELSYPFLDNVRPSQNILPVLIRERFPLAVRVLFHYIPFMLLIIPKRLYWYTFKYFLNFVFIIILPVLITGYALYTTIRNGSGGISTEGTPRFLLNILQNFGFLFLSYIFGRIMAMTGMKAPASFSGVARDIIQKNPTIETVLFGHTHNPEQKMLEKDKWYFNTGTWIPVFETSSADVRIDKTYTFIAINPDEQPPCRERLQRWNDDAGRIDIMILNEKI